MKIKSIKKINYNEDTYNLHIKNNHNYFANNINVSNCHRATASTISDIINFSTNAKIKSGMTGSLGLDLIDNLKIEGSIGKVNKILTMRQSIDLGIATEILIKPLYLQYSHQIIKDVKKMNWQTQDKYIRTFKERCSFIAKLATQFKDKNVMIVYKNIDSADMILEEIIKIRNPEKQFKNKDYQKDNEEKVYYSRGDTKSTNRNDFRKLFEQSNDNILIGTTSVIATGINIKNLHVIIFANIGKSNTLVQQALGRVARLHTSKDTAHVYDIVDDLRYYSKTGKEYPNYNYQHFLERLDMYINQEFEVLEPIKVKLSIDTLY